jgi:hypothetical protein
MEQGANAIEPIRFIASLPPTQTAIQLDGRGDGARIKLDVPATELAQVLRLILHAGRCIKVTVEPE